MTPATNSQHKHLCDKCTCLGQMTVRDVTADLYVCDDLVIARMGDSPDNYRACHMKSLTITSDVFLLAAFRLYLDTRGEQVHHQPVVHTGKALQS